MYLHVSNVTRLSNTWKIGQYLCNYFGWETCRETYPGLPPQIKPCIACTMYMYIVYTCACVLPGTKLAILVQLPTPHCFTALRNTCQYNTCTCTHIHVHIQYMYNVCTCMWVQVETRKTSQADRVIKRIPGPKWVFEHGTFWLLVRH